MPYVHYTLEVYLSDGGRYSYLYTDRAQAESNFDLLRGLSSVRRMQLLGWTDESGYYAGPDMIRDFIGRAEPKELEHNSVLMGVEPSRSMF
jgi:hypothetical protein